MSTITTKELTTLKIPRRYHHTVKSRLAIVHYATDYGIKGAARRFGPDRKTVRAWRRRLQAAGLVGLVPRYLPQPAEFAHAQMGVFLFPDVEGGVADTELPAQITDRGATLGLSDGIDDLLFGKS